MNKTRKIELMMDVVRIVAVLLIAYGVALVILFLVSEDPVFIVKQFILGPFSSPRRIGSMINLAVPFTICGLSMCFMYAVNKFNLAGEGIFMVSACIVSLCSIKLSGLGLPMIVMVPLMYVVAAAVGVVVSLIPAILDRKFNANVVVVSLMLNSIIAFFCVYVLRYFMKDNTIAYVASVEIPKSIQLPKLFGSFRIQFGLVIALICVAVVVILFYKTSFGLKMRLVGAGPRFSKAAGLSVLGISFAAQLMGGAFAGIAGATELMSNYSRFQWLNTTQHGFDGLLVAVLAKKNPALVPVGALFLAYIRTGANVVNSSGDIPVEFITVIQGIIILLVAAESFLSGVRNKLIFKQAEKDLAEKKKAEQAA